ncbi:MAG TPA: lytic murein transglycosylase [Solirubrobacteraceae bacterium]|jgi:membrane-bound lytic murein transglycosylase B|nr:lytic murein transglycosylase [Solirubrobacteraceae bacterium]
MRAVLGTLAGGGLTAAALGGPLAPGAFAGKFAEVPTTPEVTASSEPAAEAVAPAEPTNTSTTPAPTTTTGTTTTPQSPATPAPQEAPAVALQRRQKTTKGAKQSPSETSTAAKKNKGKNNVEGSPQSVAKAGALAAVLASSQASVQALAFYRVPLFLLPVYKAAAVQYGVPWQILAAINEIETDYGTDQSVSSAGAVGWMQFMPETWMQYGVDALNSGYADPYNPVDAVFAAARYLRAAGAATNLRQAILAYNHSEEYVDSVMLRAKLISTYPKPVIATLTGLVDGRPPVDGKVLEWGALPSEPATASSPRAGATATTAGETAAASAASAATPGASSAPSPTAAAAAHIANAAPKLQTVELTSSAQASVVAVHDGRVMQIGDSRKIGRYIVLRDVYGDLFTYAGLGSIAPTYTVAKPTATKTTSAVVKTASTHDPAPSKAATAGSQTPVTLQVKTPAPQNHGGGGKALIAAAGEAVPAGMDRKRLFVKPGNPDAKAAAVIAGARRAAREKAAQKLPLRKGSVVSSGTVLGTVTTAKGAHAGHLRFGIRPAGDAAYIDPGPILANWAQLQKALHPQGARSANALLGATASDVFLLSKSQLERTILSDPGVTVTGCSRQDIASGVVDYRVLALLAFLSRSGLKPTVGALRCGQSQYTASGALSPHYRGDAVDITAINDVPLARHQGPGTITDLTIRALLTLPGEFVPHEILSLMHYPASASTRAESSHWNKIELVFAPATKTATPASTAAAAHSAGKGKTAPVPVVSTSLLSPVQWTQLIGRVGAIATPKIAFKPTSSAIPDPKSK